MKGLGRRIRDAEMDIKKIMMGLAIPVILLIIALKESANTSQNQVTIMKDSGLVERKMVLEFGKAKKVNRTLENGKIINHKDLEF